MKLNISLAIIAAILATATPTHAGTPPPVVEVQAGCAGLTVATSGWPEGSDGIIGFGSAPPWGATINGTATYTSLDPGDLGWFVLVRGPGQEDQRYVGEIECDVVEPEPVDVLPATTAPAFEPSALWPGLELADPW